MTITQRPWLSSEAAQSLIAAAQEKARSIGVTIVVHVADPSGNPIAMLRMDGAPLFSVEVAAKKAWTAAAGGVSTLVLRDVFNSDVTLLHALAPSIEDLMAVGGGAPVLAEGQVAGAVGVSGASEEQDQEIADAAAASLDR